MALVALLIMITIHEFGHYIAGKLLSFKIQEFSIGFGPVLYKKVKKNGEIFYIKAIPLGGYCAFGEDDTDEATQKDPTAFNNQAPWKRLIVLSAGVIFNFISAILFSVILLLVVGYNYTLNVKEFATSDDNNPAFHQTLEKGDKIMGIEGEKFTIIKSHTSLLTKYRDEGTVDVLILRDGEEKTIQVLLHEYTYEDADGNDQTVYGMGIVNSQMEYVKLNFFEALGKAFIFCCELAWMVLVILWQLITGQIAITKMGGTVATIAVMADVMQQSLLNLLLLFPLISVNLAIFNALPIPALDGARMVFVGIEWARGKPVNRNLEAKIHTWGLIVLFGLVVVFDLIYMFVNVFN
jgi:regulator of sigma E protease